MDSYEVIEYISKSEKKTPVKVYIKGNLKNLNFDNIKYFGNEYFGVLIGEWKSVSDFLDSNKDRIDDYYLENDRRNSAIPMLDLKSINSRIEPGAIIRDKVNIGNNCVIMMGSVINIGAEIGDKTMIDMNAVIGGNAKIGCNCHIGAGAVVAGVIEPPNADPVRIGDNVVIGANAVILEGVQVGANAVIAAGAIVLANVEENQVVAGAPARVIKTVDEKTRSKTLIMDSLRELAE